MKITKRTSHLELFDSNPVVDFDGELSLFFSFLMTRGKKLQAPYLHNGGGTVLQFSEAISYLERALEHLPGSIVSDRRSREKLKEWLEKSYLIETEPWNTSTKKDLPVGGVRSSSYLGLRFTNPGIIRDKYWGGFLYLAFSSDLLVGDVAPSLADKLAGKVLNNFLSEGLCIKHQEGKTKNSLTWKIEPVGNHEHDSPLEQIFTHILSGEDAAGDNGFSLPKFNDDERALKTTGDHQVGKARRSSPINFLSFVCPGSIILMKHAVKVVLSQEDMSRERKFELLKNVFTLNIWLYYRRSIYVYNEIELLGHLPESCEACWSRFQDDLIPEYGDKDVLAKRQQRWKNSEYKALATEEDARFVADTCDCCGLFFNMGNKEQKSAVKLATKSLNELYEELKSAELNRIWLGFLIERMNKSYGIQQRDLWLDRIFAEDRLSALQEHIASWIKDEILKNESVSDRWQQQLHEAVDGGSTPKELFLLVREFIAEHLGSRDLSRYREILNSMMGGGELPTNQNPRGLLSGAGAKGRQFYPTLQGSSLELLVLLASEMGNNQDKSISFHEFMEFMERYYGIFSKTVPENLKSESESLIACTESVNTLRERLRAAGFLTEFSDSEDWNRVSWSRAGASLC